MACPKATAVQQGRRDGRGGQQLPPPAQAPAPTGNKGVQRLVGGQCGVHIGGGGAHIYARPDRPRVGGPWLDGNVDLLLGGGGLGGPPWWWGCCCCCCGWGGLLVPTAADVWPWAAAACGGGRGQRVAAALSTPVRTPRHKTTIVKAEEGALSLKGGGGRCRRCWHRS